MNLIKKVGLIIIAITSLFVLNGCVEEEYEYIMSQSLYKYVYNHKDYEATIVNYISKEDDTIKNIEVPSEVMFFNEPYTVTAIGYQAFFDAGSLKNIILPNGIKIIEDEAFTSCSDLISINIPENVVSIGDYAFHGCRNLKSIDIPSTVNSIGLNTFFACLKMTSINVDEDNQSYSSVDGVLYNKDKTRLIVCPAGKKTNVDVVDGVTSIDANAFYYCREIKKITLPNTLLTMGDNSIRECSKLQEIIIPNSVVSIGVQMFSGNESLTSVTLSENLTTLPNGLFEFCEKLKTITIPKSVTTIVDTIFSNCHSLSSINVDPQNQSYCSIDGILYTKDKTQLLTCPGAKENANITEGVVEIKAFAFAYNYNLKTVTIPNSVKKIEIFAFSSCESLKTVTIPNSVVEIGYYAFASCESLTSIYIPTSVLTIGERVFVGNDLLTIYTSFTNKPNGWNTRWNYSSRPVEWGYKID